jgi:hypothetical protein
MVRRGASKSLVATVLPKLGSETAETVEALLTREYEFAIGRPALARGFTALRFYLRDLFEECTTRWPAQVGGVTNYQWLVRQIEEWRGDVNGYVLWVTFNYDGLLDQALEDLYRYDLDAPDDDDMLGRYLGHEDWSLIKLHGSYDWRRKTEVSLRPNQAANDEVLSYHTIEERWDPTTELPSDETRYSRKPPGAPLADGNRDLWVPALMAPLASKSSFECPPSHVRHLIQQLAAVDLIYSFGWRAQEDHFLGLLGSMKPNPPDIYALTGRGEETARDVINRLLTATGPGAADNRPRALSDTRLGFSAVARDRSSFSQALGDLARDARDRREQHAGEVTS